MSDEVGTSSCKQTQGALVKLRSHILLDTQREGHSGTASNGHVHSTSQQKPQCDTHLHVHVPKMSHEFLRINKIVVLRKRDWESE